MRGVRTINYTPLQKRGWNGTTAVEEIKDRTMTLLSYLHKRLDLEKVRSNACLSIMKVGVTG